MLVVEDLHLCDPSTIEFLGLLIEQIETSTVMVLVAFRPEAKLPWPRRSNQTPVVLGPLRRSQVATMITSVAGGRSLSGELVEFIIDKAGGMPLYVEEITKMVIESEQVRLEDGCFDFIGEIETLTVPMTLQDSLMARLDNRAEVKELAQLASVIGREFIYKLLATVADLDESELRRQLAELVTAELFYQRGVIPSATFTFKHALIQETAYQSLLHKSRQEHHARIARALEKDFPDLVEAKPEMMAHHCESGERNRQNLNLPLLMSGCQTSAFGWGHANVTRTHNKIRKIYKDVEDPNLIAEALLALLSVHQVRGEYDQTARLGLELSRLGRSLDNPAIIYMAEVPLGCSTFFSGRLCQRKRALHAFGAGL